MRPIIGIACRSGMRNVLNRPPIFYTNKPYIQAIEDAGGLPVLLPVYQDTSEIEALFTRLDGIMLAGGIDIDPSSYGEQVHAQISETDPQLDRLEILMTRWALKQNVPFLGICRGQQLLNVALGGTLYQDIDTELPDSMEHSSWHTPRDQIIHTISIEPTSRSAQILGAQETTEVPVNSLHHQAIKQLGKGLVVTGRADDGVIEMVEVPQHCFMVAAQCHPEELYHQHPAWSALFQSFIEVCQQTKLLRSTHTV